MSQTKKFTMLQLAQCFLDFFLIREESFDMEAAEKSSTKTSNTGYIDCEEFYRKTEQQAIKEAIKKHNLPEQMELFIHLASYWGNDIIDWAEEVKARSRGKEK